ncbi:MAG: hypothetical protein JNM79_16500 [Burkholderiales bacterium]|nr:hypothetical protein [Burkholderiales bacterium]
MSIILDLFRLAWAIYWLVGAALLAWVVWRAPKPWQKATGAALVLFVFGYFPVKWGIEDKARREALIARNNAIKVHFEKRCKEDARITIHRVVEHTDGILVMRPRKRATDRELEDQYWMGDPYGYSESEAERPQSLLFDSSIDSAGRPRPKPVPGYEYVEVRIAPGPDNPDGNKTVRCTRDGPNEPDNQKTKTEISEKAISRYGFDWEDISTEEDRKYWVAGGRTRIFDLRSGAVIAERIGYLVDREQGGRVGGRSWLFASAVACPPFTNVRTKTLDLLAAVVPSARESRHGK